MLTREQIGERRAKCSVAIYAGTPSELSQPVSALTAGDGMELCDSATELMDERDALAKRVQELEATSNSHWDFMQKQDSEMGKMLTEINALQTQLQAARQVLTYYRAEHDIRHRHSAPTPKPGECQCIPCNIARFQLPEGWDR